MNRRFNFKVTFLVGCISAIGGFYLTLRTLDPSTAPVSEYQAGMLLVGGLCIALVTFLPAITE